MGLTTFKFNECGQRIAQIEAGFGTELAGLIMHPKCIRRQNRLCITFSALLPVLQVKSHGAWYASYAAILRLMHIISSFVC